MAAETNHFAVLHGGLVSQDEYTGFQKALFRDPETFPFSKIAVVFHGN